MPTWASPCQSLKGLGLTTGLGAATTTGAGGFVFTTTGTLVVVMTGAAFVVTTGMAFVVMTGAALVVATSKAFVSRDKISASGIVICFVQALLKTTWLVFSEMMLPLIRSPLRNFNATVCA